ncbi:MULTISPECIES: hypothetical protein [Cupriavidus]
MQIEETFGRRGADRIAVALPVVHHGPPHPLGVARTVDEPGALAAAGWCAT